ncbi:MAG: flagellar hook protein FlgE [Wenzhouxiangella sp.]|jgi:flagellar hook protein FlgE|nr:flagellar hook protein FlgE [Wenzhouxiangella sp.]
MPFQIALSGLNAASTSLNTTANNIANVNTTGFKASRANFVELFATGLQSVSTNATGLGARTSSIQQQFAQGSLEFTDNNLDLALVGGGFFTLRDEGGQFTYTRAGNFSVNRDGFVINDQALRLQAFPPITGTDTFNTGTAIDLQLDTTDAPPSETTSVSVGLNLPSDATPPTVATFDPTDPDSYNHTTSVTVYDSLGAARTATYYFAKDAADNTWNVFTVIDGTDVTGTPSQLVFDTSGQLTTPANGEITLATFDATPANPTQNIVTDFTNVSQFGSSFNVNSLTQDGFASGRLASIEINTEGVVFARFTNGQSTPLGQLAITNFQNPEGLENVSDTRWAETFDSGQALRGAAGTGNLGTIQAGALETANVDLATELVDMITAQRTYQANAQMISTADQVTQTIINIR